MSNAIVKTPEQTWLMNTLENMKDQLQSFLPKHVTVDKLNRSIMASMIKLPKLIDVCKTTEGKASMLMAVVCAAQWGLEPGTPLGHCHLIPYGNKVQLIPGFQGLTLLMYNSGQIDSMTVQAVLPGDDFDVKLGTSNSIEHIPAPEEKRGDDEDYTHVYACVWMKGAVHAIIEVMTRKQVDGIRDRSAAWKTALKYGKTNTPWHTDPAEMARKTVTKRIVKRVPLSADRAKQLFEAVAADNQVEVTGAQELVIPEELKEAAEAAAGVEQEPVTTESEKVAEKLDPKDEVQSPDHDNDPEHTDLRDGADSPTDPPFEPPPEEETPPEPFVYSKYDWGMKFSADVQANVQELEPLDKKALLGLMQKVIVHYPDWEKIVPQKPSKLSKAEIVSILANFHATGVKEVAV